MLGASVLFADISDYFEFSRTYGTVKTVLTIIIVTWIAHHLFLRNEKYREYWNSMNRWKRTAIRLIPVAVLVLLYLYSRTLVPLTIVKSVTPKYTGTSGLGCIEIAEIEYTEEYEEILKKIENRNDIFSSTQYLKPNSINKWILKETGYPVTPYMLENGDIIIFRSGDSKAAQETLKKFGYKLEIYEQEFKVEGLEEKVK